MPSTPYSVWLGRTAKTTLPSFLHPLASGAYVGSKARLQIARDYLERAFFRLSGRSYLEWYARRQDRAAEAGWPAELLPWLRTSGKEDLDILIDLSLRPQHTLHGFGIGFLRCAAWFIDYLEPGNFSGNDTSGGRIKEGREAMGREKLLARNPRLLVTSDNSFDWMEGHQVDYIWSHAVFSHMPDEDVEDTIRNMCKIMHAGSAALVTYSQLYELAPGERRVYQQTTANFQRTLAWYEGIVAQHGFDITELDVPAERRPTGTRASA